MKILRYTIALLGIAIGIGGIVANYKVSPIWCICAGCLYLHKIETGR